MKKRFFPMFVDISDKQIVVIGGGSVAERRVRALLQFTRNVRVVAAETTPALIEMGRLGQIDLQHRPVKKQDLREAYIVVVCSNDRKLNDDIYRLCKEEGIYVNVSSDRDKCDFYFPGVYLQDEMVIGLTATGLTARKAKIVREEMQEALQRIHARFGEDDD